MRQSQEYAKYKLKALSFYLEVTNTAMRDKWPIRYYIDLQAGPGKNKIGNSVLLGSPLIALTSPYPATHIRVNELDPQLNKALQQRVHASPYADRVRIYQEDANKVVQDICDEISNPDINRASLNIAFLDPEGIELAWTTVEQLAKINRMDLIINFSTSGLVRAIGAGHVDAVNRFFGTDRWKEVDNTSDDPVKRRRSLIDFYRSRLEVFNYKIEIDPNLGGNDIAVNNSKNSQVYSMIFASKHELGEKFWRKAAKSVKPPKLPGFD